ncbi:hypothetical protein C8R42DRAFT_674458 [Lentinula raphanica]|nr:hypothetical protein C8R42DRAFT_674458 [Lentinula raphanica]
MVYSHSIFTTLLAFGAASFVFVRAVPIDMNTGPSLLSTASTSTPTSDSYIPTSTSLSAAAPCALLSLSRVDPPPQSDGVLLLPERHQRRAPALSEVCIEPYSMTQHSLVGLQSSLFSSGYKSQQRKWRTGCTTAA